MRWLERYGRAAPIEFGKLLHLIENQSQLTGAIAELLDNKRQAPELGPGASGARHSPLH